MIKLLHFFNYIDPGTGSMLFTVIIGIATTLFFVLRGVLIKFKYSIHGGNAKEETKKQHLILFSDSRRYWNVFRPICEELEKREIACEYWTASPDDPALKEDFHFVTCRFIGEGNKAFARLNVMNSRICLATTPGLDVLQWKRSRDVDWYVHLFHAIDDGTLYRQFGLDYYDAVLLNGTIQETKIRRLEEIRGLVSKELVLTGSVYLDAMKERLEAMKSQGQQPECSSRERQVTVLCAPSWGPNSILNKYGGDFLQSLIDTGYHIIVRPHPQSKTSETELLSQLHSRFPEGSSLEWNEDNDNFAVLNRSDLLISDFSGVIFDFSFVFDKPVIYADTEFDKAPYDADWLEEEPWILASLNRIGRKLEKHDFPEMKRIIDEVLQDHSCQTGRNECRKEAWSYEGESTGRIVDYIEQKLQQLTAADRENA